MHLLVQGNVSASTRLTLRKMINTHSQIVETFTHYTRMMQKNHYILLFQKNKKNCFLKTASYRVPAFFFMHKISWSANTLIDHILLHAHTALDHCTCTCKSWHHLQKCTVIYIKQYPNWNCTKNVAISLWIRLLFN